jgi:uncharacterized phage-associated protein
MPNNQASRLCRNKVTKRDPPCSSGIMQIRFSYNIQKAIQAISVLLRCTNGKSMDKAKLMKLVYLADRAMFIQRGIPITGDQPFAMKLGPVPSNTLNLVDGDLYPIYAKVYNSIQLNNYTVSLHCDPGEDLLSEEEKVTLRAMWYEHGHKETIPLCYETHHLPEWKQNYVEGTSTPIPYEEIARHSGNPARFRLGRVVISPEMAEVIPSPFKPETDLVTPSNA